MRPGRSSLVGKLLLSTALVAVSLAYGWWQRNNGVGSTIATVPMPAPPIPAPPSPVPPSSTPIPATIPAGAEPTGPPETAAKPKPVNKSAAAASAPSTARAQVTVNPPALLPAAPVSALAELQMYQAPPAQTPLPPVTGTPAPGAAAPIPPGTHLQDGDYVSDTQQYEWGDLTVKISVHGGQIRGAQVMQYPDHRAESLDLSKMASPILCREVIETQQAKVDVVSSATDTSFAFQYAIASALIKATRE